MARQSPNRPAAEEPTSRLDESGGSVDPEEVDPAEVPAAKADPDAADLDAADSDAAGTAEVATDADSDDSVDRSLWEDVRVDPVEIALPAGSGFTLRAYRLSTELTPTDVSERDADDPFLARSRPLADEDDDEAVVILDEEFAEALREEAQDEGGTRKGRAGADGDPDAADGATSDAEKSDADDADGTAADDDEDDEESEQDEPAAEEVPVFLSHRGKLLVFKTPESLVAFVRSGAPNDLAQIDTWDRLVERIQPDDVTARDEDTYELDLVVENLRGGHDVWDAPLLIGAGEAARDLAYALRLPAVLDMLSPGSSLDDLDEALRAAAGGGFGGFRGRRRLKKIGAQTASLGWRTIIGKISGVVDWRD